MLNPSGTGRARFTIAAVICLMLPPRIAATPPSYHAARWAHDLAGEGLEPAAVELDQPALDEQVDHLALDPADDKTESRRERVTEHVACVSDATDVTELEMWAQVAWRVHARIVPQGLSVARARERVPRGRRGAAGGRAVNERSFRSATGGAR